MPRDVTRMQYGRLTCDAVHVVANWQQDPTEPLALRAAVKGNLQMHRHHVKSSALRI